jgi:hypothetical protein
VRRRLSCGCVSACCVALPVAVAQSAQSSLKASQQAIAAAATRAALRQRQQDQLQHMLRDERWAGRAGFRGYCCHQLRHFPTGRAGFRGYCCHQLRHSTTMTSWFSLCLYITCAGPVALEGLSCSLLRTHKQRPAHRYHSPGKRLTMPHPCLF